MRYHVAIDTAALSGTQGRLSFQFNPASIAGSPDVQVQINGLNFSGGVVGTSTIEGDVSQFSSNQFTIRPTTALNRFVENVTLGALIEFDLELVGLGLFLPLAFNSLSDMFAVQLFSASGVVPLLAADGTGSLLRVRLLSDGTTEANSTGTAVTVAASGRSNVTNGSISMTLSPFTIQEGLEFNGPSATFTDGNPLEIASGFTATIDWGDGSPITNGIITGMPAILLSRACICIRTQTLTH